MADVGLNDFGIFPGEWYGINAASQVFETLDKLYKPVKNMRICTFQDGNVNLAQILRLGCESNDPMSEMKPDAMVRRELDQSIGLGFSTQTFDFEENRNGDYEQHREELAFSQIDDPSASWCNQVLVVVNNRFGIKGVSREYYQVIKKYMKLSTFTGLVGG